jgi:hypothetical protein
MLTTGSYIGTEPRSTLLIANSFRPNHKFDPNQILNQIPNSELLTIANSKQNTKKCSLKNFLENISNIYVQIFINNNL